MSSFPSSMKLCPSEKSFIVHLNLIEIPRTFPEVTSQNMKAEMEVMKQTETWELISLPLGRKTMGSNWVYSVKYKADGLLIGTKLD